MPEKSGFFDSTSTDVRTYPARDFADYFAQILTNGVFNGGQYLNPTATGTDAMVKLSPGYAWIMGYVYSIYSTSLSLQIQPAASLPRIDRIVLRLDTSLPTRSIRALVIQGSPNSNPTAPPLTRSGDVYELSLAQVRVDANSTIITQANITDERLNNAVCGLVNSLVQVDTTVFQQQWDEFIREIQQEGFATTEYVDNRVLTGGYGATTNSGNAYSVTLNPAPAVLVAGLRATVRINAANTGAATINVNGLGVKPILKSNGNALASNALRANSVYSLVYNGTAFILQGEGGEYGTAVAGDVLAGKTIGTENGLVTGTIINRGAGGTVNPGSTAQTKLAGYYSSDITISPVSAERMVSTSDIPVGSFAYATFPKLPQLTYINSIDTGNNYVPSGVVMVGNNPNVIKDPNSGSIIAESFTSPRNSGRSFSVNDWDATNKRFRINSNSGAVVRVQAIAFLDTITT
jgi:hypothetical protein